MKRARQAPDIHTHTHTHRERERAGAGGRGTVSGDGDDQAGTDIQASTTHTEASMTQT